jgi:cytochrome c553
VVKHGIKFTGMPGWPDLSRDDEVWAMVAFLRRLPDMDAGAYGRLARAEPPEGAEGGASRLALLGGVAPAAVASCERCHGRDGQGRAPSALPRLAGQNRAYLVNALAAFAEGRRSSGIMRPVAAALDRRSIEDLAGHFAARAAIPSRADPPADAAAIARGAAIARQGLPELRVPPCMDCHGPSGRPGNPAYPRLAGQYRDYLVLQLELFHTGRRGGSSYAELMKPVARGLPPARWPDVAAYYASLAADAGGH